MSQYEPSVYFTWSVHLDGDETMHDASVCQKGIYERAVAAIKLAKTVSTLRSVCVFTRMPSTPYSKSLALHHEDRLCFAGSFDFSNAARSN